MLLTFAGLGSLACGGTVEPSDKNSIDLSTESGVMNFVYALTQLQFNFYTLVNAGRYSGMLTTEFSAFFSFISATQTERNDLSKLIVSARISDGLEFKFGSVMSFQSRADTLGAARTIAESCANGFSGIRSRLTNAAFLSKLDSLIVSTTSRASTIRGMLGLGPLVVTSADPSAVFEAVQGYYLSSVRLIGV